MVRQISLLFVLHVTNSITLTPKSVPLLLAVFKSVSQEVRIKCWYSFSGCSVVSPFINSQRSHCVVRWQQSAA